MTLFFFLLMVFTPGWQLQTVTMPEKFHDYGTCLAERDAFLSQTIRPVTAGEFRYVTACLEENLTQLPRCYTAPPEVPPRIDAPDLLG